MQAFQIDIDHWRHVFLLLGAVWGLETARVRWMERRGLMPIARPIVASIRTGPAPAALAA